jgi:hypothetical protein
VKNYPQNFGTGGKNTMAQFICQFLFFFLFTFHSAFYAQLKNFAVSKRAAKIGAGQ